MTAPLNASPIALVDDGYVAGACNIGPWEIRRRRAFAIIAFAIGLAGFALLVASGAPAILRVVLLLPFWGGALSWLQARRRFCAGFAVAGLSNFGDAEASRRQVTDASAHHQDMLAVMRMTRDAFVIGLAITAVAVLVTV
jgi:hypothetical protein